MTTARQVNKLLSVIAEQHPSLVHIGQHLVLGPVRHVLCCIWIDRTRSADIFNAGTIIDGFFPQRTYLPVGGFGLLYPPTTGTVWRWSNARNESDFWASANQRILDLTRLRQFDECYPWMMGQPECNRWMIGQPTCHSYHHFFWSLMAGELEVAEQAALHPWAFNYWSDWPGAEFAPLLREFGAALPAEHRRAIAANFHETEARTISNLGLEPYWEPTPFPLETRDDLIGGRLV